MKLAEYQIAIQRTMPDLGSIGKNQLHMQLGMLTEAGELADIFKRKIAYGKEIDIVNVKEEIGDYMWYLGNDCNLKNISLFQMEKEIEFEVFQMKDELEAAMFLFQMQQLNIDMRPIHSYQNEESAAIAIISGLKSFCELMNIDFEECLFLNIEKLYKRFPEKFSEDKALIRNLEEERKVLEGK